METKREWFYCHLCHNVQRDRRAYRDHLLRVHGEVARRGSDIPERIRGGMGHSTPCQDEWAGTCRPLQGSDRTP